MKNTERSQQEPVFSALPDESPLELTKPPKWLRILAWVGLVYGLVVSVLGTAINATAENLTMLLAILFSGSYALLLFLTRKVWAPAVASDSATRNAAIFAVANAFFISFIMKLCAQLVQVNTGGGNNISNYDLLVSVPWLVGLILLFIPVQQKHRFSWPLLLILGAFYEFIMEVWLNGLFIPLLSGKSIEFFYNYSDLFIFGFWQFAILYSPIYLVIGWITEKMPEPLEEKKKSFQDAMKPLICLVPYTAYIAILYLFFK